MDYSPALRSGQASKRGPVQPVRPASPTSGTGPRPHSVPPHWSSRTGEVHSSILAHGIVLVTSAERGAAVMLEAAALRARGSWFLFLPPYSPEWNPIVMAFAKLKAHLRPAGARTYGYSLRRRIPPASTLPHPSPSLAAATRHGPRSPSSSSSTPAFQLQFSRGPLRHKSMKEVLARRQTACLGSKMPSKSPRKSRSKYLGRAAALCLVMQRVGSVPTLHSCRLFVNSRTGSTYAPHNLGADAFITDCPISACAATSNEPQHML
jgi:hypothetical protein